MTLVKYIKANRSAPLFTLAWQGAFFLVGLVMVLIINTFLNEDPDYACMGTLFVLCGTAVGVFARGNLGGNTRFSLAVSMGQTRLSYVLFDSLITLFTGLLGMSVAWCVYQIESRLYAALYPGFTNDMPMDGFFQLKYILPIVIALVFLELIFTAITLRFGQNTFRVIWLTFCFSFLIIPRMIDAHMEGSTSIFGRIGTLLVKLAGALSLKIWIAVGVLVLLGVLGYACTIFRRAEVKL